MWERGTTQCRLVLDGTHVDRLQVLENRTVVLEYRVDTLEQAEELARWWRVLCAVPTKQRPEPSGQFPTNTGKSPRLTETPAAA
jgi:hypothetical protein